MTDEEILAKYKDIINADIVKYCQDYGLVMHLEKENFSNKYKSNFVKGFRRGIEKGQAKKAIAMAKEMLANNEPIAKIVKYTGLSVEQIQKI